MIPFPSLSKYSRHFPTSIHCLPLAAFALTIGFGVSLHEAVAQSPTGGGGGGQQQAPQQSGGEEDGIKGFWEIELDGGRFVARLDTISSVSEHQYIVDGARVYEVTVDTTGSQAARFYYLEPMVDGGPLTIAKTALDRAKEVAQGVTDRTGTSEVWDQVIKVYPDTTHARTAEYRLQNREVLRTIYNHIYRVWAEERGKGEKNKLRIIEKNQ